MRSLSTLSAAEAKALRGLVFDLDGTFLSDGRLELASLQALGELAASGLGLVVCTGRPAAWGEVVQRLWPVDATVTENGAVAYRSAGVAVERLDRLAPDARGRRRAQLLTVLEQLRLRHPEVPLADDNLGRLSDVTFDIGERAKQPEAVVQALTAEAHDLGARTFRSSIHLHITLDADDKASGTLHTLSQVRGEEPSAALSSWAFVGDSANDQACFTAFRTTFGVRNITAHLPGMTQGPRYVSDAEQGAGFVEIAERLLALRKAG
ncbi:MAG: HAD hydrolase family protein [Myxococcales bacterium]|nr:HAD hydrolase family protein [Myxococcales bacterium]